MPSMRRDILPHAHLTGTNWHKRVFLALQDSPSSLTWRVGSCGWERVGVKVMHMLIGLNLSKHIVHGQVTMQQHEHIHVRRENFVIRRTCHNTCSVSHEHHPRTQHHMAYTPVRTNAGSELEKYGMYSATQITPREAKDINMVPNLRSWRSNHSMVTSSG